MGYIPFLYYCYTAKYLTLKYVIAILFAQGTTLTSNSVALQVDYADATVSHPHVEDDYRTRYNKRLAHLGDYDATTEARSRSNGWPG